MSAPVSTSAPAAPTIPGARPRLLLLDGHSLAYRAFFALPVENFSTTTGQPRAHTGRAKRGRLRKRAGSRKPEAR